MDYRQYSMMYRVIIDFTFIYFPLVFDSLALSIDSTKTPLLHKAYKKVIILKAI